MDPPRARFKDETYLNWLGDSLCLQYVKEALEGFCDNRAVKLHIESFNIRKHNSTWKIKSCMSKVCSTWLQVMLCYHVDRNNARLATSNFEPCKWPTHPWDVAKFYQPFGCETHTAAKDADAAALLTFLHNCQFTRDLVANVKLIEEVLSIRHTLMHTSSMRVEEAQLQHDTGKMIELLESLTDLAPEETVSVETAIEKIKQVQKKTIDMTLNEEKRALIARMVSLETQQKQAAQDSTLATDELKALTYTVQHISVVTNQQLEDLQRSIQKHEDNVSILYQRQRNSETEIGYQMTQLNSQQNHIQRHLSELQSQQSKRLVIKPHQTDQECALSVDATQPAVTVCDIQGLQTSLKRFYKAHLTVPIPMVEEDVDIDRIYVDPDIKLLRETTGLVNVQNRASETSSQCRSLFYTDDYKCKQIYICGKSGIGKSVFCKHLVDLWCNAPNSDLPDVYKFNMADESDSKESDTGEIRTRQQRDNDMKILAEFPLLFYLNLRNSTNKYQVSDMIEFQILQHIHDTPHLNASYLLNNVHCLIIMDGLDEWVCPAYAIVPLFINPGIPGRSLLNQTNTFLTTTRPWKFDKLELKSSDVDKHVELVALNKTSSKILSSKLITFLNRSEQVRRNERDFSAEVERIGLSSYLCIPVILTHIICIWFDKKDFSPSQVKIHCSMVEMLLQRSIQNLPEQNLMSIPHKISRSLRYRTKSFFRRWLFFKSFKSPEKAVTNYLPLSFTGHTQCHLRQELLMNLARVAFEALFDLKRENSLLFKSSQKDIYGIGTRNLDLCLKTGILSQEKVLGNWSVREKKMSFLHKNLQEFLAAIYITVYIDRTDITSIIKRFCSTPESMLEMSQVWMFVAGMRADLAGKLLTDLITDILLNDTQLQQHRQSMCLSPRQRDIQTCINNCMDEARKNGFNDLSLPLYDFVINTHTHSECLENLLTSNITATHSVHMTADNMDTIYMRLLHQLQNARSLQKLNLIGSYKAHEDNAPLRNVLNNNRNSLIFLELWYFNMTPDLLTAFCSTLKNVTVLCLRAVVMTHEQHTHLLLEISKAVNIKQLHMSNLNCNLNERDCRFEIDLTRNINLNTLVLREMYLEKLLVSQSLQNVTLASVTMTDTLLRQFICEVASIPHMVTVKMDDVLVEGYNGTYEDLTDLGQRDKLTFTNFQRNTNDTLTLELKTTAGTIRVKNEI